MNVPRGSYTSAPALFILLNEYVVHYFVSILVLQSSGWGRESWLLRLFCLSGVS